MYFIVKPKMLLLALRTKKKCLFLSWFVALCRLYMCTWVAGGEGGGGTQRSDAIGGVEERGVLAAGALGHGDAPDEEAEDRLGDDVRDGVADLDCGEGRGAREADHGEEEDHGVSAPADDSDVAGAGDQAAGRLGLAGDAVAEAEEERVDNEDEGDHR